MSAALVRSGYIVDVEASGSYCHFGRRELGFFGRWVSKRGVAVDPQKIAAVELANFNFFTTR
jgi:hypothetical protein